MTSNNENDRSQVAGKRQGVVSMFAIVGEWVAVCADVSRCMHGHCGLRPKDLLRRDLLAGSPEGGLIYGGGVVIGYPRLHINCVDNSKEQPTLWTLNAGPWQPRNQPCNWSSTLYWVSYFAALENRKSHQEAMQRA